MEEDDWYDVYTDALMLGYFDPDDDEETEQADRGIVEGARVRVVAGPLLGVEGVCVSVFQAGDGTKMVEIEDADGSRFTVSADEVEAIE